MHAFVLQGAKGRARADCVELFGIAQEDNLRGVYPVCNVHQIAHLARIDHGGFIENDQLVRELGRHGGDGAFTHPAFGETLILGEEALQRASADLAILQLCNGLV